MSLTPSLPKPSRQRRFNPPRTYAWLHWADGIALDVNGSVRKVPRRGGVGAVVAAVDRLGRPDVIFLCGPMPTGRDWARRWALSDAGDGRTRALPDGWAPHARSYWPRSGPPVLRYVGPDGRTLWLYLAESWFATADVEPGAGRDALATVARALRDELAGTPIQATPLATAQRAMERTIPDTVDLTPWPDVEADQVRAGSGQHRMEWIAAGELAQVVEVDMHLAYGALCRELGSGPPVHYPRWEPYARARWYVRFAVPVDWDRPYGLLPVVGARRNDPWRWPAGPGSTAETWADGWEVSVAMAQGWPVEVVGGVGVAPPAGPGAGDPLGKWARQLCALAGRLEAAGDDLAYRAVRSILLQGIGGLMGGPRRVTGLVALEAAGQVPADAIPGSRRRVGPAGEYVEWAEWAPSRRGDLSHPEWAARIWARERTRLLTHRDGTGVLGLPGAMVAGFGGDAIYLTGDPGWPYEGRPGQWRVKGVTPGPLTVAPGVGALDRFRALRKAADGPDT